MAQVGLRAEFGIPQTIDAADEISPFVDPGSSAGLVVFTIVFNGTWNGTLTFQGGVKVNGTMGWDPILATNLVSGATATTTVGATTTTERWRIDATGLDGVRVYGTTVTGGSCTVTPTWAMG
jgi:hypothetical protein